MSNNTPELDGLAQALAAMGKAAQETHDAMALAIGRAFMKFAAQQPYDPDAWMYEPHPQQRWIVRAGFVVIGVLLGVIVVAARQVPR